MIFFKNRERHLRNLERLRGELRHLIKFKDDVIQLISTSDWSYYLISEQAALSKLSMILELNSAGISLREESTRLRLRIAGKDAEIAGKDAEIRRLNEVIAGIASVVINTVEKEKP